MGEVYRARDSTLGRDVALKILPGAVADDPERVARFRREAQILATLNHPHIGAIHGFDVVDGAPFLVLELVEGETLGARIARGRLPLADALDIARQICDALEAAHAEGIVHRDLKPANIMLRTARDSERVAVKVLDFGLAKTIDADRAAAGDEAATLPLLSRSGMIVGTPDYMSPEQAKGLPADRRTDLFALGCVLYEMVTGRRAFAGDSVAEVLAAIIQTPPDWSLLPPETPPAIRRLLRRCLEKDRGRRLQSAGDARLEIDEVLEGRADEAGLVGGGGERTGPRRLAAVGVIAALAAGGGAWLLKPGVAPIPPPIARLVVTLPPGDTLGLTVPSVAISPDGRRLAYAAVRSEQFQLFVRLFDSIDVTALAGTEGASAPFFSPDGQWIGFFAQGKLKKVLAAGGGLQTLCDAAADLGGTWAPDGSIYFAPLSTSGIWTVPATGGTPREFSKVDREHGEFSHRWPQVLPDGHTVLFTIWTGPGWDEKHLALQNGEGGERRILLRGASTGRYVSSGHLLYAKADELVTVPFDRAGLRVTGAPVTLVEHADDLIGEGTPYAVSDTGTLVYIKSDAGVYRRQLVWVGTNGQMERLPAPPGAYTDPEIAPDGRSVALSIQGAMQSLWIYDFTRATLTTLPASGSSQAPVWTPDGHRLIYRGTRTGHRNLFWRAANGDGEEERLSTGEGLQTPGSMSPDGVTLVFTDTPPGAGRDVWMVRLDGDRTPRAVLQTPFNESAPHLSPDGKWLAYSSTESGRSEIYVRPFPDAGGRLTISTDGGSEPRWSRDGRELFYRNGERMLAVTMTAGSMPAAGPARLLFTGRYQVSDAGVAGYDVAPDGRFLMIEPKTSPQSATQISVVLNWFDEVRARIEHRPADGR